MKILSPLKACFAVTILTCTSASAGDPCPISFNLMDMGVTEGLNRDKVLKGLKSIQPRLGLRYRSKNGSLRVTGTDLGSAAEKAGLQDGDIIQSIQGTSTTSERDANQVLDANLAVGKALEFVVMRGQEKKTVTVIPTAADPLLWALVRWGNQQECAAVDYDDRSQQTTENAAAVRAATQKNGTLRCKGTHRRLQKVFGTHAGGEIVLVRDQSKVLLSMSGFRTMCVKASDYDGEKLTEKRVGKLFKQLTRSYIKDRYDNP